MLKVMIPGTRTVPVKCQCGNNGLNLQSPGFIDRIYRCRGRLADVGGKLIFGWMIQVIILKRACLNGLIKHTYLPTAENGRTVAAYSSRRLQSPVHCVLPGLGHVKCTVAAHPV